MLKAFIDDSRMNQPPVYVLAGWVAPAKTWAKFSDDWSEALRMKPRIRYFKFSEAMNFDEEFRGFSLKARDEKMTLLLRIIEEHGLLGVASVIPHDVFQRHFGSDPNPEVRNPYYPSLYGLVAKILNYNKEAGVTDRLDLFFDYQPGHGDQMQAVRQGWETYRNTMPPEFRPLVQAHPPTFLDDQVIVALQAADLCAGWVRTVWEAKLLSKSLPHWPWGGRDADIQTIIYEWNDENAAAIYADIYGLPLPVKFSFTFHHGVRF